MPKEKQDNIANHRWQMGERNDANSSDVHAGGRNTAQWRYCGHRSGELLDPLLVQEGREIERNNLRNLGVYERVPRHLATGKRVFESSG